MVGIVSSLLEAESGLKQPLSDQNNLSLDSRRYIKHSCLGRCTNIDASFYVSLMGRISPLPHQV
jgi:hypothetical protein